MKIVRKLFTKSVETNIHLSQTKTKSSTKIDINYQEKIINKAVNISSREYVALRKINFHYKGKRINVNRIII